MKLKSIILTIFAVCSISIFSQSLTFNVKTVTYSGKYSPSHVLAIWVTDANGKFVKTIDRHANQRIAYLTNWIASSAKNVVDASTGATINSHPSSAVTYTWNCTNVNKVVVPDGSYFVNVEFTEIDGTGKYVKFPFTIGPAGSNTFTSPTTDPGKYFQNVSYAITVSAQTLGVEDVNSENLIKANYSSKTKSLEVSYDFIVNKNVTVAIFDLKGANVKQQVLTGGKASISLSNMTKGVYAIKVIGDNGYVLRKKIIIR